MADITNPIHILVLNGVNYDLDKVRSIPGTTIEVERNTLVTDINCSPLDTGLHALTVERAVPNQFQTIDASAIEYVSETEQRPIVLKHHGKMLLLMGHEMVRRSTKPVLAARLITTVGLKNYAKLPTMVETPSVAEPVPAKIYPTDFKNAPRFQSKPVIARHDAQKPALTSKPVTAYSNKTKQFGRAKA